MSAPQQPAAPESLWRLLRGAAHDVWRARTDLFLYQVLVAAISFAVLSPLVAWAFRQAAAASGKAAVGNLDILWHLLTPTGGLLVLLATTLGLGLIFADVAGLVVICWASAAGQRISAAGALRYVAAHLPRVLAASLCMLLILIAVAVPFLLAAWRVADRLLQYDINYYLYAHPPEFWTAVRWGGLILTPALAAAIVVAVPLTFVVPEILLTTRTVRGVLESSYRLAQRQRLRILLSLVTWLAVWQLLSLGLGALVLALGQTVIDWAGSRAQVLVPLLASVTAGGILAQFALSCAAMAFGAALLVRLYRAARSEPAAATLEFSSSDLSPFDTAVSRRVPLGIALAAVIIAGLATRQALLTARFDDRAGIIAHRGSSLAKPENSLSAVRQAIADGATGVEIDVQCTADGHIVVAHDADMMRLAGNPAVIHQSTLDELRAITFSGERVATLDEILNLTQGYVTLVVELKSLGAAPEPLVQGVVQTLQRRQALDQAVVMSFSYPEVRAVKQLEPRLRVGFLASARLGNLERLDVDFLAVSRRQATIGLIAAAHLQDRQVYVWTINDRPGMVELLDRGVDSIITKDPALLVQILAERERLTPLDRLVLRFKSLYLR